MCGVNCIVDLKMNHNKRLENVKKMNSLLEHRGPDFEDIFHNELISLGHRRLSILDLSDSASQPMKSSTGRYQIVFNGEIYNYLKLKQELQNNFNTKFFTTSDTEVILELIEKLGFNKALEMLEGMFAIILFDQARNKIHLARDRFGEKPLFYFNDNERLIVSSELKPIIDILKSQLSIDMDSLDFFLRKSFIEPNKSIFNEVKKVSPGAYLEFSLSNIQVKQTANKKYWDYMSLILSSKNKINNISYEDAKEELRDLLYEKVKLTMCSDVPLGAFLSGGYDSSCIVSMMQDQSNKKIKTFSVGFQEDDFNEANFSKKISEYIGTDHQDLYVNRQDMINLIEDLPSIYSEPFADSSQIPTLLLSKMTKSKVTVSLSGDGADEIFGGYRRYFAGEKTFNTLNQFPLRLRSFMKNYKTISRLGKILKPFLSSVKRFDQKIYKLESILDADSHISMYRNLAEFHYSPFSNKDKLFLDKEVWSSDLSFFEKSMIQDTLQSLPGDMLTKVDIAGMSVSLETRMPFLNHKIAEFVMNLPFEYLFSRNQGKYILKDIVHDMIPKTLMDRPKKGFDIPLGSYLQNELKDYCFDNLSYGKKHFSDIFDLSDIDKIWKEHQENLADHPNLIWNLVSFFSWHKAFFNK